MGEIDLGLIRGRDGTDGAPGANATINGMTAITLSGGNGIQVSVTAGNAVISLNTGPIKCGQLKYGLDWTPPETTPTEPETTTTESEV